MVGQCVISFRKMSPLFPENASFIPENESFISGKWIICFRKMIIHQKHLSGKWPEVIICFRGNDHLPKAFIRKMTGKWSEKDQHLSRKCSENCPNAIQKLHGYYKQMVENITSITNTTSGFYSSMLIPVIVVNSTLLIISAAAWRNT